MLFAVEQPQSQLNRDMSFPILPSKFEAIVPDKAKSICEVFSKMMNIFSFMWTIFTWMINEDKTPTEAFRKWLGPPYMLADDEDSPGKVSNLEASDDLDGRIELTWVNPAGATKISIARSLTSDINDSVIIQNNVSLASAYTDTPAGGIELGVTYYYWVRASNSLSPGEWSDPDTGIANEAEIEGDVGKWVCCPVRETESAIPKPYVEIEFKSAGTFLYRLWSAGGAGGAGYLDPDTGKHYVGAGGESCGFNPSLDEAPYTVQAGDVIRVSIGLRGEFVEDGDGGNGGDTEMSIIRDGEEIQISVIKGGFGGKATKSADEIGLSVYDGAKVIILIPDSYEINSNPGLNGGEGDAPIEGILGCGGAGWSDESADLIEQVDLGTHGAGGDGGTYNDDAENGDDGAFCYRTTATHTISQHS